MPETLGEFFLRVTGKCILPYQFRYGSDAFRSTLLIIPTGLGKTETVLVPWLFAVSTEAPRPTRLIVVLPRQNLTEQTARRARELTAAAGLSDKVRVLELMGGSEDNAETLSPDQLAVIVSTQDLYLSRALNRGYARRPPRWPIDFALMNNDSLVVFDEVQLMSDGLATATQLAAMRHTFGAFGQVPCVWMSATVKPEWLDTVDFKRFRPELRLIQLGHEDLEEPIVQTRISAGKRIAVAPEVCHTAEGCARFALSQHRPVERTLVMTNTVARAREIYRALLPLFSEALLVHSRFRPADRKALIDQINTSSGGGQIIVATQVLEAGIDLTSSRLITDVAPWGSLVQRFGRVNRYGEAHGGADIWWVEVPLHNKVKADEVERLFGPYDPAAVKSSVERLRQLTSAAPRDLPPDDGPAPWRHVLRRADLLDLFDTSPDLSGNDIDISRFIRSGEERDVYIGWRDWQGDEPSETTGELSDDELCPAPIHEVREFARRHALFRWNFRSESWGRADREKLYPGMVLLARAVEGGYTSSEGWTPESKQAVPVRGPGDEEPDGDSRDKMSFTRANQALRDHTEMVRAEMRKLIERLAGCGVPAYRAPLECAAALHDWGKAHEVMQATLRGDQETAELLAKSKLAGRRHKRKHFRHELASALAMLATGESDLAAYLAAAHHGKVRLSIRSMPGEPEGTARGIREGDLLPPCEPATGHLKSEVVLSLEPMKLGRSSAGAPSWTERVLKLRDAEGPFRLAYLEMLVRAADERASARVAQAEVSVCARP